MAVETPPVIPPAAPPTPPVVPPTPPVEAKEFSKSEVQALVAAELKRKDDEAKAAIEKARLDAEVQAAKEKGDFKKLYEQLDERLKAAEADAKKQTRALLVERVGVKHNLKSLIDAGTLTPQGESEIEIEAWAEKTTAALKAAGLAPAAAPVAGPGGPGGARTSPVIGSGFKDSEGFKKACEDMRRKIG